MEKLKIFLFGNFQVHLDDADITDSLRTRKERALFAYLAEEPAILQTREKVAEFFWPNRPETYARMNLRQALAGLRRSLGGDENANLVLRSVMKPSSLITNISGWIPEIFPTSIRSSNNTLTTNCIPVRNAWINWKIVLSYIREIS